MHKIFLTLSFFALFLPACAQDQQGFAPSNGVNIHYKIFGKGEPIVIINGGPGGNSEGFAYIASLLAEKYQAIIFDQRGTGKSVLPKLDSTTITMNLMREDLEALRKHLKLEKWVLMGQSFGGMLASYYASKYPDRVKGLIYSASGGLDLALRASIQNRIEELLTPTERKDLAYWNNKMAQGDTTRQTIKGRANVLASAYVVDKKHQKTIAERLLQVNLEINAIVWGDLTRIGYDCKPALKDFRAPALILQGRQDIITVDIAETAHRVLRNSRLVLLDKCSHYGWLDAKEKYISEIHKFMKKL
ncbi:MAG: alpha/beta fold hydrolase [Bacteroidetes bacterium]|nr:MAG: alpha/beta fold hydrolase [Bacteroidota bacterium]